MFLLRAHTCTALGLFCLQARAVCLSSREWSSEAIMPIIVHAQPDVCAKPGLSPTVSMTQEAT